MLLSSLKALGENRAKLAAALEEDTGEANLQEEGEWKNHVPIGRAFLEFVL